MGAPSYTGGAESRAVPAASGKLTLLGEGC